MPLLEQASRFKFSLSIDGKAAPWRLALQLPLESTIIRQDGGPFGEFFDARNAFCSDATPSQRDVR